MSTTTATKSQELKLLEGLAFNWKRQQSPSVPLPAIVRPKFSDNSTNDLTKAVHTFLKLRGHYVGRTNTQGQYRADLGRWVQSGSTRGQADLNVIINGRSWQIEIKYGSDKLSEAQEKVRAQVEAAGGVYLVVKSFRKFIEDYVRITDESFESLWILPSNNTKQIQQCQE